MMLHAQDTDLLMLDPENKNVVLRMDLNRPDVVQKWVCTVAGAG